MTGKVRRDHPDTAHEAAVKAPVGLRRDVLELLCARGVDSPKLGLTDQELVDFLERSENSIRPRRVELVDAGYVEDSGERRPSRWNRPMIVWRATPAGREALREAIEGGRLFA